MPLTGEAKREYQRLWVARNREAYLRGKVCAECGATTDLEVDHIDPALKLTHRVWSWSATRRAAELAKCQVLCRTHHAQKTRQEQSGPDHGTAAAWHVRRCRCDTCREWKRLSAQDYRARTQEAGA